MAAIPTPAQPIAIDGTSAAAPCLVVVAWHDPVVESAPDAIPTASDEALVWWTPLVGPTGMVMAHRFATYAATVGVAGVVAGGVGGRLRPGGVRCPDTTRRPRRASGRSARAPCPGHGRAHRVRARQRLRTRRRRGRADQRTSPPRGARRAPPHRCRHLPPSRDACCFRSPRKCPSSCDPVGFKHLQNPTWEGLFRGRDLIRSNSPVKNRS